MSDDEVRKIVQLRGLSSENQKRLWARGTVIKRLLIKAGLTTHEAFDAEVEAMVRDINNKMEAAVRKDLGLMD